MRYFFSSKVREINQELYSLFLFRGDNIISWNLQKDTYFEHITEIFCNLGIFLIVFFNNIL